MTFRTFIHMYPVSKLLVAVMTTPGHDGAAAAAAGCQPPASCSSCFKLLLLHYM